MSIRFLWLFMKSQLIQYDAIHMYNNILKWKEQKHAGAGSGIKELVLMFLLDAAGCCTSLKAVSASASISIYWLNDSRILDCLFWSLSNRIYCLLLSLLKS